MGRDSAQLTRAAATRSGISSRFHHRVRHCRRSSLGEGVGIERLEARPACQRGIAVPEARVLKEPTPEMVMVSRTAWSRASSTGL
jgi:hypothetical protein